MLGLLVIRLWDVVAKMILEIGGGRDISSWWKPVRLSDNGKLGRYDSIGMSKIMVVRFHTLISMSMVDLLFVFLSDARVLGSCAFTSFLTTTTDY